MKEDLELDDIITRIHKKQMERDHQRAFGGTSSTAAPSTTTYKDIVAAAEKINNINAEYAKNVIDAHRPSTMTLLKTRERGTVSNLITQFNLDTISLVKDPEPGCEMKMTPEDAFDYAMNILEK